MAKTDIPGIYKEEDGILVNKDNAALNRYREKKAKLKKLNSVETRLESMENDITMIKEILLKLVSN
jgi:hypothetical protein